MWLSKQIEKQSEFKDALCDLERLIRNNKDATKIPTDRTFWKRFFAPEFPLFRPNVLGFSLLIFSFAAAGFVGQLFGPNQYNSESLANLVLQIIVPIFVLAVSITTLAYSLSESGRFAAEYLYEACRMPQFCCFTFVTTLLAISGRLFLSISGFPLLICVLVVFASLGAAIGCVTGLAFDIREVIRCTRPTESVKIASNYAAKKLSLAYLKDAYLGLWMKSYGDILEQWCLENCYAIHPPSQYISSTMSLLKIKKTEMLNDVEVELSFKFDIHSGYMDYNLRHLKKLDKQLKERGELFLAPHHFRGEKALLGTFRPINEKTMELLGVVKRSRCSRFQPDEFQEESEDFWESNFFKLHDALKRAITNLDPEQMQLFLKAVTQPIHVLRKAWKHPVVREWCASNPRRSYQLVSFYLDVVKQILEEEVLENTVRENLSFKFLSMVRHSIWVEIKEIFKNADYITLQLFCSLVPQMYKALKVSHLGKSEEGNRIRGRFGDFYAFSDGLFEHLLSETGTDTEEKTQIRLVLQDGLTSWLLIGIADNDSELIRSLCDAGRRIVFHDDKVYWDNEPSLKLQHCILAGNLISRSIKGEGISAENIKHLFFEEFSTQPQSSLTELLEFYSSNDRTVFQDMGNYLRRFEGKTDWTWDPLTGGGWGSARFVSGGNREFLLSFIYLALHSLFSTVEMPQPMPVDIAYHDLEARIVEVKGHANEVFGEDAPWVIHNIEKLAEWFESCKQEQEKDKEKEIAKAKLEPTVVEQFDSGFWSGYARSSPFLSYCLKNNRFLIKDETAVKHRLVFPKRIFLDDDMSQISRLSTDAGRRFAFKLDQELLRSVSIGGTNTQEQMTENNNANGSSSVKETQPEDVKQMLSKAANWLNDYNCDNLGVIVFHGGEYPDKYLWDDNDFNPSWREANELPGFQGFYLDFPLIWLRDQTKNLQCIALNLRTWQGIHARTVLVKDRSFGEMHIRPWTKKEFVKNVTDGKIEHKKYYKTLGSCSVEATLFWKLEDGDVPAKKFFSLK